MKSISRACFQWMPLALAIIGAASLTDKAEAAVSCSYALAGPGVLEVTVSGEPGLAADRSIGLIKRAGDAIQVIRINEQVGKTKAIACAGGVPTVTNTDLVVARLLDGGLRVSQKQGRFAPGAAAEADGTSEIEFQLQLEQSSTVFLSGTEGQDRIRLGRTAGFLGANLNAEEEAAPDVDLILNGSDLHFLQVDSFEGRDRVTGAGGPEFEGPFDGPLIAGGGNGNDTLEAGGVAYAPLAQGSLAMPSILIGGRGNDRLFGAEGADVLVDRRGRNLIVGGQGRDDIDTTHGGSGRVISGPGNDTIDAEDEFVGRRPLRDRIDCGRGRDYVDADEVDRLERCEKGYKGIVSLRNPRKVAGDR